MLNLTSKIKDLYKYRVLIQSLVSRELKARYRGTVLGFLWSFINPMLLLVIYTFVFGYLGSKSPVLKLGPLMMFVMMVDITNEQTYSFIALVTAGLMALAFMGFTGLARL